VLHDAVFCLPQAPAGEQSDFFSQALPESDNLVWSVRPITVVGEPIVEQGRDFWVTAKLSDIATVIATMFFPAAPHVGQVTRFGDDDFGGQISALEFSVKRLDNSSDVLVAGSVPLLPRTVPFPLGLVDRADKVESNSLRLIRVIVEVADYVGYVAGESLFGSFTEIGCPNLQGRSMGDRFSSETSAGC